MCLRGWQEVFFFVNKKDPNQKVEVLKTVIEANQKTLGDVIRDRASKQLKEARALCTFWAHFGHILGPGKGPKGTRGRQGPKRTGDEGPKGTRGRQGPQRTRGRRAQRDKGPPGATTDKGP